MQIPKDAHKKPAMIQPGEIPHCLSAIELNLDFTCVYSCLHSKIAPLFCSQQMPVISHGLNHNKPPPLNACIFSGFVYNSDH